jgi:DNA (cytosine-5)-methyltransferase 1
MKRAASPTLIDLFAGCGGVTQGFKNKGFRVLAAVEIDPITVQTYKLNHPDVKNVYAEDIQNIAPKEMMKACNLRAGVLSVLSVCAPCQPYSGLNLSKQKDNRTDLVLQMKRFVKILQPQFAIMENIPDLAQGKNRPILDNLVNSLRNELGYYVLEPQIVDAVNYGVPQFRKRLILLCSQNNGALSIPEVTHVAPTECNATGKDRWHTVREAFGELTRISLAAGKQSQTDPLHKAPKHSALVIERLKRIPKNGGSRKSLPEHLRLKCHQRKVGHSDVYGRMAFDKPSNTIRTGFTSPSKGRFVHPTANRGITPREAARLQTFPDDYYVAGNYAQICTQIGNAVPVRLAEVFADYFYKLWLQSQRA